MTERPPDGHGSDTGTSADDETVEAAQRGPRSEVPATQDREGLAPHEDPARRPLTAEAKDAQALVDLLELTSGDARQLLVGHQGQQQRWQMTALGSAWASAATASISGLSIWADYTIAAGVLAIVAALLSTFLATVNPADIASKHRSAAVAFDALVKELDALTIDVQRVVDHDYKEQTSYDYESGQYYDAGYYYLAGGDLKKIASVRRKLNALRDRMEGVQENAPILRSRPYRRA